MKFITAVCAAASSGFALADAAVSAVTPVQKVVQLMEGMLAKGQKDKHAETVQFAAFKQFCEDTTTNKRRVIDEATEKIAKLAADIRKGKSVSEKLGREISGHDEDISVFQGDVKATTNVRAIEKTDHDTNHKDLSESVDALGRAIAVLREQDRTRKQQSLVQVAELSSLRLIPDGAKKVIDTFLQASETPDILAVKNPEAHGYEFQSSTVVDMLEGLEDKFVDERTVAEKTEADSRHQFAMLAQDLKAQIAQSKTSRSEKAEFKARTLQAKANNEGDLIDTQSTKAEDAVYLGDLEATCSSKATDYEARQLLRTEELQAINKAIEIISSGSVGGKADKHLPALVQRSAVALAQLRSGSRKPQARVAAFLERRAGALNSRVLEAVAQHAQDDPFGKVKKMIQDMITRLMEEANDEAEHDGWCKTELAESDATRTEKTTAVESLHAQIDQLETSIQKVSEDLVGLAEAVAELTGAMAEATQLRSDEKTKNEETVADAKEAQVAVSQALTVLQEFYAKAGESVAFVQRQQPVSPEIFDGAYTGMQSENGGVIGMLEVIASDFARLEADTEAAEAVAQKEHDTFMTDSKVDKSRKEESIDHKKLKKTNEKEALTTKTSDLELTQKELDAALAYFDKLKPTCVDAGVSYEDRVARREEEIQSLKEALRILSGEDIA